MSNKKTIIAIMIIIIPLILGDLLYTEAQFSFDEDAAKPFSGIYYQNANETRIIEINIDKELHDKSLVFECDFFFDWTSDRTLHVIALDPDQYAIFLANETPSVIVEASKKDERISARYFRPDVPPGKVFLVISVDRNVESDLPDNYPVRWFFRGRLWWSSFHEPSSMDLYDAGFKPMYVWGYDHYWVTIITVLPVLFINVLIFGTVAIAVITKALTKKLTAMRKKRLKRKK
jgi:hypothetical protein